MPTARPRRALRVCALALLPLVAIVLAPTPAPAAPRETAVTVLADFEDDSIAAAIGAVENVVESDCAVKPALIPARGQRCLAVEVGATNADSAVACELTFREATLISHAEHISAVVWIKQGTFSVAFLLRDARGQVFETARQPVREKDRWVEVRAALQQENIRRLSADSPRRGAARRRLPTAATPAEFGDHAIAWPIEVLGFRVGVAERGRQVAYVDDLQVQHRVEPHETIVGGFRFDKPTKLYQPGATVAAAVVLENRSRSRASRIAVELAWIRPDGVTLRTQQGSVNLPASGGDFRSRQAVDFSQKIDEPGLYRLLVRARESGWTQPNVFETTIAVLPSNRNLPRGRSTFLGLRSNLLREPLVDQDLEVEVARDLGAHLVAIDTPWRLIEPKRDAFEFGAVARVVDALVTRGVGVMLVLTEPPDWLPTGADAANRQALLIEALAGHFGDRVPYYQLLSRDDLRMDSAALGALQKRVTTLRESVRVVAAPVAPGDLATVTAPPATKAESATAEWGVVTEGAVAAARQVLADAAQSKGAAWGHALRWTHRLPPLAGAGFLGDARDVLALNVDAAAAGVAGVIWFDLRDDDNDPENREALRGLLRRDFSPKAAAIGFATSVGLLTGLRYAGTVHGAPDEFESALFIGADRQVALLLPRPNRRLPAMLAPIRGVPGALSAVDFERRALPVVESAGPALIAAIDRPLAVTLAPESPQPQPQIGFSRPWVRAPRVAFCGPQSPLVIEVDPPAQLQKSYLQIVVPEDAPFDSSVAARTLRGKLGDTLRTEVVLTPRADAAWDRSQLTLRLSLEGKPLEIPIEVQPDRPLRGGGRGALLTEEYRVAELVADGDRRLTCSAVLYAAWEPGRVHLAVTLRDDKLVPENGAAGDRLLLGVAVEGGGEPIELRLPLDEAESPPRSAFGTDRPATSDARRTVSAGADGAAVTWQLTIELPGLNPAPQEPPQLRVAARFADDDGRGPTPALRLGTGLDGSRSSDGYCWLRPVVAE